MLAALFALMSVGAKTKLSKKWNQFKCLRCQLAAKCAKNEHTNSVLVYTPTHPLFVYIYGEKSYVRMHAMCKISIKMEC